MQLLHVALWTKDLELLRTFYAHHFNGKSNEKYENTQKGFSSYFVSFEGGGSLEIMQRSDITESCEGDHIGLAHIAFRISSKEEVNARIESFRHSGYTIVGEPRYTGDGYYEGAILDPEGNTVELVAHPEPDILRALFPPYELLLFADPDKEKVDAYINTSDCYVANTKNRTVGVIVVQKQGEDTAEIMNLAVEEFYQRRGIARKLLRYITEKWAPEQKVTRLLIRTGTSAPGPLQLYQQEGFDLTDVNYNYFTDNYKEPIIENGIVCRHQLVLEKRL